MIVFRLENYNGLIIRLASDRGHILGPSKVCLVLN